MQSAPSRIWTQVAVSISYNDNHYTTGTTYINVFISIYLPIYLKMFISLSKFALSAGAVEYTDCFSAEG